MTNETGSELKNLIIKLIQFVVLPNDIFNIGIEPIKVTYSLYKSIIEKLENSVWREPYKYWLPVYKTYEIRFNDPNPKIYDMADVEKRYEPAFDGFVYVIYFIKTTELWSFLLGWDAYVSKTKKTFKADINVIYSGFEIKPNLIGILEKVSSIIVGSVPDIINTYTGPVYIDCKLVPFIIQNVNKFDLYLALLNVCADKFGSKKYYIFCEPIKLSGPDETEKIKNLCNLGIMALIGRPDRKMQ